MPAFHHGITAQELTQGILPMRNANISVIGLIATASDADDEMYPIGTPVLLAGITQANIDKAGTNTDGSTLRDCLQTIRDIHNPTVVVLRFKDSASLWADVNQLDILLTAQSRLGVTPKILAAPAIDTPAVTHKLASIAKRRRGFYYFAPRRDDGTMIEAIADIVKYRDTFGAREVHMIENEWGTPVKK